jgi:LacI family transcriptional regulator
MRHVAILIETSRAYGRGLLHGISRYAQEHRGWSTLFQPQGLGDPLPPWFKGWKGDGIIARIENSQIARAITAIGVPTINLRGKVPGLKFPFIGSDNRAVATMAADHLLERGYERFGFFGFPTNYHAGFQTRGDCFSQAIEKAGYRCHHFEGQPDLRGTNWERQQARLAKWIHRLPKPIGIMTANDDLGFQLLSACHRAGTEVPESVAVLGVDNDTHLCDLAIPSLSSIDINTDETGYRAAQLLDRLMSGRKLPKTLPSIPPKAVVVRRSTDILATDDQAVLKAVTFIRLHASQDAGVAEVLQHVGVSRSTLEPRFKKVLRRTIHDEIRRVRLSRAKELLKTTVYPIKWIAHESGYKSAQYLTRVFVDSMGKTPANYRRENSAPEQ